jgi:hypothetical protein
MGNERKIQLVSNHARLDAHAATLGINLNDAVKVTRHVDDDSSADDLPGQGSSGRPWNERGMMGAGKGNELADVVLVPGKGDRLRHLPIDGRIGGVEFSRHRIEMKGTIQFSGQSPKVGSAVRTHMLPCRRLFSGADPRSCGPRKRCRSPLS